MLAKSLKKTANLLTSNIGESVLNQAFTQIAGQLEKIAEDFFGENVMEQNADSIIRG